MAPLRRLRVVIARWRLRRWIAEQPARNPHPNITDEEY